MKRLVLLIIMLAMVGCAMPNTYVRSVDSRPSLAIKGASSSADLLIDGLIVGKASRFNGDPQVLVIEPGTHRITVMDNGIIVYERNTFVESEMKTITIR